MGGRGQRGDGGHRGPGHDGDGGGLFPVIGSTEHQTSTLCSHLLLETDESDQESGESDRIELDLDPTLLTCIKQRVILCSYLKNHVKPCN